MNANLRKAAVLLRSLDGDTAALMLGRLSREEADAIRNAMRTLGAPDADQQANVIAELRREKRPESSAGSGDVELSLSSSFKGESRADSYSAHSAASQFKRFEFLESASVSALVRYLSREHAQTIAVVLSHLAPERAANILAGLLPKIQADTIERLSALGETDPDALSVLERELEAWFAKRGGPATRRDTMSAILAAADEKTRTSILGNMKQSNAAFSPPIATKRAQRSISKSRSRPAMYQSPTQKTTAATARNSSREPAHERPAQPRAPAAPPLPRVDFDDLIHLDSRSLASVLREADSNVLALALAGSRDEMVDRICAQMPKRTARAFRRELRRLGPTRLSDVEMAQQVIAQIAARQQASRASALQPSPTLLMAG